MKVRIIRAIRKLFEAHFKPVKFDKNDYIEYESNGDRNKTLSIEEQSNEIRPYLKDINNFKKSDK